MVQMVYMLLVVYHVYAVSGVCTSRQYTMHLDILVMGYRICAITRWYAISSIYAIGSMQYQMVYMLLVVYMVYLVYVVYHVYAVSSISVVCYLDILVRQMGNTIHHGVSRWYAITSSMLYAIWYLCYYLYVFLVMGYRICDIWYQQYIMYMQQLVYVVAYRVLDDIPRISTM